MGTLRRTDMSSKKLVYLFTVLIVCGLIAGGTAHGQSVTSFNIGGTVTNSDGDPVTGAVVRFERISLTDVEAEKVLTGTDGSYKHSLIGLPAGLVSFIGGAPEISAGEEIRITVLDGGTAVHTEVHTVTVAEVTALPAGTTIDITLTDFAVEANPSELPADGTSTATITVTVGAGVTEAPTLSADKGTVSALTSQGNGVYTATYTAPSLVITFPPVDIGRITATLASTGQTTNAVITLLPVPTTVTVAADTTEFSADTPGTGTVTVTVDRAGPVTDENVTLSVDPADGGTVTSPATNNADGTYTATYTSGSKAGYVDIIATATGANASGEARVVINAGPPANIVVTTDNDTVSSFGSATITARVTDSNSNGVGGLQVWPVPLSSATENLTEFRRGSRPHSEITPQPIVYLRLLPKGPKR